MRLPPSLREGHGEGLLTAPVSRYVRPVFWLRRPPYLRWIIAAAVLLVGGFLDTRSAETVDYPHAESDIHAGQSIADQMEWRRVPAGLLPRWEGDVVGYAVTDLAAGTPLLPSLVDAVSVPDGWWSVAISLPQSIGPGTPIRVSARDTVVTGILSGEVVDNGYEFVGPVAFPANDAALVAAAAASDTVVVMIGSASSVPASAG